MRRRHGSRPFQPVAGKQLRVIPLNVIHEILREPFRDIDNQARQQILKKEAKRLAPLWQNEWLEIKEKYPNFASSIRCANYGQDFYGVQIPAGFPIGGPRMPEVEKQVEFPKIPPEPLPYLMSELSYVFPALTRYIKFYYQRLNISLPDPHRPTAEYTISKEYREIVNQATAHLTILRSNEKKGV